MASQFIVPFGSSPFGSRDPFRTLQREMNRMLDDTMRSVGESGSALGSAVAAPAIDIHESAGELCITADLPGVNESAIDLRVDGDLLTIRGEKTQQREQDQRGYHLVERSTGSFQRMVRLPFAPDPGKVEAEYADGVLTVHVSKQDQQERSRRIEVRKGAAGQAGRGEGQQQLRSAINDQAEPPRQQAASEDGSRRQSSASGSGGQQPGESGSGHQPGEGGRKGGQQR